MKPSSSQHTLYGWQVSHFTGKARAYLRHKAIPFREEPMNLFTLLVTARRRGGAVAMPAVLTPAGEWLQDTKDIIDALERAHPVRPVIPVSAVRRVAAQLFELWADEAWSPVSLHTRWNFPENHARWIDEAGRNLLPSLPAVAQGLAAKGVARSLLAYLAPMGITPEQIPLLEAWTKTRLDELEQHFSQHDYVLGAAPTVADFGLYGPLYAHLSCDPWPQRELMASRPHVRAWVARMTTPPGREPQAVEPDLLPASIEPVFRAIGREFVPLLSSIAQRLREIARQHPLGKPLPRGVGPLPMPMLHGTYRREGLAIIGWMTQRILDGHAALAADEQKRVREWLASIEAEALLDIQLPRLERRGLSVAVVRND